VSSDGIQPSGEHRQNTPTIRVLTTFASAFLVATVALTFTQVILRFLFNNPQAWAEEVSRYLFVWIVFIGAAVAVVNDAHIRVDVLIKWLGLRGKWRLQVFISAAESICFGFVLYAGWIVSWRNRGSEFYTIPGLPQVVFYLAVPVGATLMLLFMAQSLVRARR
jgi:TRAP-type C4-dicarboxylate transport system permease small subunit